MTALPSSLTPLKRPRLPSVETQTVAFVASARAQEERAAISRWLHWRGFYVYLRYWRNYEVGGEVLGEVLVLASVEIPQRFRRRGWLWCYCELCYALVEDGLILERVINKGLERALSQRPEFVEVSPGTYLLKKRGPGDWPRFVREPTPDSSGGG